MSNPEPCGELPPAQLVETTPLISLVHHRWAVDHQAPLEEVEKEFRDRAVDYLALVRDGHVTGVCSRANLGALLSSRFGFSLYARSPAHLVQVARPLVIAGTMPVRQLLELALARPPGDFREDVALVDAQLGLIGLIPIERIAHLQNRLVAEQVSSLKSQHESLRRLERNAQRQEKQRLLDTLVGGIAHELNNKLTPILGLAELLAHESGSDLIDHAALISRSAQEASRIIRQLLQLSKPNHFEMTAVDLRAVVEESLLMLKFKLRETKCEWRTHLPAWPAVARADADQLKQVVINFILNAIDAVAGRERPLIEVSISAGEELWQMTVSDNGAGIAPEHLSRVFDPFFTTKAPNKGTGLGLSISQSIVRQHGGEITVVSRRGEGTAFSVTLPFPPNGAALAPSTPGARFTGNPGAGGQDAVLEPDPVPRSRVLVVDDEEVVRLVLQEMLRSGLRCEVDLAANGQEALERLRSHEYDLIVSDIRMPIMAGTDFFVYLRQEFPHLTSRLVFVTGHPGEQPLQDQMAGWGVPVLVKPFTLAQLVEACGAILLRPVSAHA